MRGSDGKHRKQKLRARPFFHRTFEYLPVNEGNGAGRYILGFCFLIGLAATGRPPREAGGVRSKRADEWAGSGRAQMLARRMLC